MALRTKSGRLKSSVRKRRLKANEPGSVILLDKTRARKKFGKRRIRSKNAINVEYAVIVEFMVDWDARKLVEMITLALAEHYRASLIAGDRADGRGALPDLRDKSKDGTFGPRSGGFGMRSGWMAENWGLLKLTGTTVRASRKIKPNGADGRSLRINDWANRRKDPVDLQSVDGAAGKVIQDTLNDWMIMMRGEKVATPRAVVTRRGTLNELRR